jgi:large subunit ribosomal protein L11
MAKKKKKLAATVKIQIPAGQATPAPPVGTALGPHGINIMDFCKAYNAETEHQRGLVIPAVISIYEDRSFTFITKTPPAPFLIRRAAGVEKGAQNVRTDIAGEVTHDEVRKIAETKMPDLNALDIEGAIQQVEGTARSMGIRVVDKKGTLEITKRDDDDEAEGGDEAEAGEESEAEAS